MIRRWLGGPIWLLAGLAAATALAEDRPWFLKQLTLPVQDDSIGFAAAVTVDPQTGEVFVCDSRRDRILVFDAEGGFRFEIAGGADFRAPVDLAVHPRGHLYVAASHGAARGLLQLDFDGRLLREITLSGLPEGSEPPSFKSVALSPAGDRLYAMDTVNLRLWITDLDGRIQGSVDFAEGLSEVERQDLMLGMVDVYGELVTVPLADLGRVRVFDLDGNLVSRNGLKGTSNCKLASPRAAALDEDGNLWIIDQQRMKIVHWSRSGGGCLGDYYGMGLAPGFFYFPNDLALDTTGRIYVAQGFGGRVQSYKGARPAPAVPSLDTERPDEDAQAGIEEAVRRWASARAERRIDDYLAAYSEDYLPWGVADRAEWATLRRAQFWGDAWIVVELSDLMVEMIREDTARAGFLEVLQADDYETRSPKTLILVWERGAWKIIEERSVAEP